MSYVGAKNSGAAAVAVAETEVAIRNVFLFTALVGAALLVAQLYFDQNNKLGIFGPLITLAPMLSYILYGVRKTGCGLTNEQIGDSFYYLGFMFTLMAIIATLVRLGFGQQAPDLRSVLGGFGLALAASGFGMLARLWMVQFKKDDTHVEAEARKSVTSALGRLATEIDSGLEHFRKLQSNSNETVDGAIKDMQAKFKEQEQERLGIFTEALNALYDRQTKMLDDLETKIRDLKLDPEALNQSFKQAVVGIDAELASLKTALSSIGDAASGHAQAWTGASAQVAAMAERMSGKANEHAKALAQKSAKIDDVIQKMGAAAGGHVEAWSQASQAVAKIVVGMNDAAAVQGKSVADTVAHVKDLTGVVKVVAGEVRSLADLKTPLAEVGSAMAALPEKVRDVANGMAEAPTAFKDAAKALAAVVTEEEKAIKALRQTLEQDLKDIAALKAKIVAEHESASEAIKKVLEAQTKTLEAITNNLEEH